MIVLDCDAAIGMILETKLGKALRNLILVNEPVVTSQLFFAEISSTLAKYVKAGYFTASDAKVYAQKAVLLVDQFVSLTENYVEALDTGLRLNHSTYDMFYFTLARRNAATLFTLDSKLIKLSEKNGVDCVH
jgi:predicted nucleic acid-binding protein